MRCIDGLTFLMMAQHHQRHAVRVLVRSRALSDYHAHARCAYTVGIRDVAIPEPGDPPVIGMTSCPICHTQVRVLLRVEHHDYMFEDPLPCDFWTR